jgi:hypothetical protein
MWSTGATVSVLSIVPVSITQYKVTGTDANGCINTDSVIINLDSVSAVTISGNTPICSGLVDTLKATATGGVGAYTYKWNPGTGTHDTIQTKTNGVYSVQVTDAMGCKKTVTDTVIVYPLPTVKVTGTDTIIKGNIDTLIANGGISYMWTSGSTKDITTVSPPSTTTYTVTVTDSKGCKDTASFTVVVNLATSIYSVVQSTSATAYPNPVSQLLNLNFKLAQATEGRVEVYDVTGKLLSSSNEIFTNGKRVTLNVSNLPQALTSL